MAREVTLLPRHWDWLAAQPGGASVALRKLVEEARRGSAGTDRRRGARDAAYRFMSAMAGDLPGFEEAARALFADDRERFGALVAAWPVDVRNHAAVLAFGGAPGTGKSPTIPPFRQRVVQAGAFIVLRPGSPTTLHSPDTAGA